MAVIYSGGRGFDSHRGQKIFSLPRVVPCFPLLGLTPSGLFMGLSSTIIYTSELILCSTIYLFYTVVLKEFFCLSFQHYILCKVLSKMQDCSKNH